MTTRTTTLAAALALALAAAGCGNKCNDQTPPVADAQSCVAQERTPVTVQLRVCPRCDQGPASCVVNTSNLAAGQVVLEPVSEVCDPDSGCPIVNPASCQFAPIGCTFTAPAFIANPGPGQSNSYAIAIVTPEGTIQRSLTVVASGASGCAFPPAP